MTTSWWIGLSRAALRAESDRRVEGWKQQRIGLLDTIGQRLRDGWDFK